MLLSCGPVCQVVLIDVQILLAGIGAEGIPSIKGFTPMSREFQRDNWTWDVFVCHAGPDKPFALALAKRLPEELRCFVDKKSLLVGSHATLCMEDAVKSTQIAVVLLCRAFFSRKDPIKELRWILDYQAERRTTLLPVFLGVTVKQCSELARKAGRGLKKVCEVTGLRHMCERHTADGRTVTREETMNDLVYNLRALTGV